MSASQNYKNSLWRCGSLEEQILIDHASLEICSLLVNIYKNNL